MKKSFILFGIAILLSCMGMAQNAPKQKLSLQEIQNLLQGTWAPITYDTVPFLYETFDKKKIHYTVKYAKDSAYLKTFNASPNYYLSFECPPDSLNSMADEQPFIRQSDHISGVCYLLTQTQTDSTSKKLDILLIQRITKDTLYEGDGEDEFISIKVH